MVDLTTVDKNAPRFKKKRYNFLSGFDFVERLHKEYPELAIYSKKKISNIIHSFNAAILDVVVTEREGISLPESLGSLFIGTMGNKPTHPNFSHPDSQNRKGRVFYSPMGLLQQGLQRHAFTNCQFWVFEPCELLKRGMAVAFTTNWRNFVIMRNPKHVNEVIQKELYKSRKRKEEKDILKDYDEFKL